MNLLIILLFNFCSAKPNNKPADQTSLYYQDLGIIIESENRYYFREEQVSVYYTRSYASVCQHFNVSAFEERRPCETRYERKDSAIRTQAVLDECNRQWNATLTRLEKTAKSRNPEQPVVRQARSILPQVFKKAIRETDIFMHGEDAINREKRGIITTLTSIFDIADFLCHIISKTYKRVTGRYLSDDVFGKLSITHSPQGYTQATNFARFGPDFEHNLKSVVHCNRDLDRNLVLQHNYALLLSELNIDQIETELLSLAIGSLPASTKFLTDLIKICSSFEANDPKYCRNIISRENLPIIFEGLEIINGTLVAYLEVKVPIKSHHFDILPALKVTNFGQFSGNNFFQVKTPELVVQNKNKDLFGIDKTFCQNNLCSMDALSLSSSSLCVQSLLKNRTEFCEKKHRSLEKFCDFRRTLNGYIIRAKNGLFVPDSGNSLSSVQIKNQTIFVHQGGTLLCYSEMLNTTHRLLSPDVQLNFEGTYELKFETSEIGKIDFGNIPVMKNSDFAQTRKQNNFFRSEIGQIVFVLLASSIMSVLVLVFYKYFPTLKTFFRGVSKRLTTACYAKDESKKTTYTKYNDDLTDETITLKTSKNDVELIVKTSET